MYRVSICFLLFANVTATIASAQETHIQDTVNLNLFDVYGLWVKVERRLLTDKYKCSGMNPKHTGSLYKIAIQQVYFQKDTVVYAHSERLLNMSYLLNDDDISKIETGKEYHVTAHNSTVPEYIVVNRIFDKKVYFNVNPFLAYQSNLIGQCMKLGVFQKIALFFGASRKKIYGKAKQMDKRDNPFWKAAQAP